MQVPCPRRRQGPVGTSRLHPAVRGSCGSVVSCAEAGAQAAGGGRALVRMPAAGRPWHGDARDLERKHRLLAAAPVARHRRPLRARPHGAADRRAERDLPGPGSAAGVLCPSLAQLPAADPDPAARAQDRENRHCSRGNGNDARPRTQIHPAGRKCRGGVADQRLCLGTAGSGEQQFRQTGSVADGPCRGTPRGAGQGIGKLPGHI